MAPAPIPEGYELLPGRSRVNAQTALATAEERGLDPQTVLTRSDGFLIPTGEDVSHGGTEKVETAEAVEIVLPTEKDSHDVLDTFAKDNKVSYDGIEAVNAEKPTKAEKVAHITKVINESKGE